MKFYAESNPNATLKDVQDAFNLSNVKVVVTPDVAMATTDSSGKAGGNYYMKEEDRIAIKKGEVVVWSYWPERYFVPFMEQVKALGMVVVEEEAEKTDGKESNKLKLRLCLDTCYRLILNPIVGEKSNELVDENGLDMDTFYELDDIIANEYERQYETIFDFYSSDDGIEYSVDDGDFEELDDNALEIRSKLDLEEREEDPDDDFILVEDMEEPESLNDDNPEAIEIFKDIKSFHNWASEDDDASLVFDAVCRRMRQIADRLVEEGLAEDAESVRFAMQFGKVWGCWYEYEIHSDKFDPNLLRTIDCTDWNDCRASDMLHEYWPDRLLQLVVYDGKLYAGSCEQMDDFNFELDLVDCNLKSL